MPPALTAAIDGSELALMREIEREPIRTQRDLSRSVEISLGMTNLLLKRLARRGLIKVRQLDWKRTQYLLTPKGALEKTRKTYDYARYTVRLGFAEMDDAKPGQRVFSVTLQNKPALKDFDVVLNGADIRFAPSYKYTEKGLLVSGFLAHILPAGAAASQSQEMHVGIEYSPVDSFPIPSRLNMEVVGTGIFNFTFDGCTATPTTK